MRDVVNELIAPAFALAGAVVMLVFKRELEVARMLLALATAPMFAWMLTASVVAWLASTFVWMPQDAKVHAAIGWAIGALGMNIVAVIAHAGKRAETLAEKVGDTNAQANP